MAFDDVKRPDPMVEERKRRAEKYTSGTVSNQSEAVRQRAATLRAQADKIERKGTQEGAAEAAKLRRLADSLGQ